MTLLSNLREFTGEWLTLHVRAEPGGRGCERRILTGNLMKHGKDIWVGIKMVRNDKKENCHDLPKLRKTSQSKAHKDPQNCQH